MLNKNKICQIGKQVIEIEAEAVTRLKDRIDDTFAAACELLLNCKGHIVVIGMGKSGHIANKIAATMASTGTPAFFVHPSEANHGDLGMIKPEDAVLTISNSGNTAEIVAVLPVIKQLGCTLISLTGNPSSILAKEAIITLDASVTKEACPLGLAPTSSTTATLALGDALAIALLEQRGFTKDDFALSHPGGILGKRLLLRIDELLRTGTAIPKVNKDSLLSTALIEITAKRMGMTTIVDDNDKVIGIFTDGDLRRTLDKNLSIDNTPIKDVMTPSFKTISLGMLAFDALTLMEEYEITSLLVLDSENNLAGVLHLHDILKTGII